MFTSLLLDCSKSGARNGYVKNKFQGFCPRLHVSCRAFPQTLGNSSFTQTLMASSGTNSANKADASQAFLSLKQTRPTVLLCANSAKIIDNMLSSGKLPLLHQAQKLEPWEGHDPSTSKVKGLRKKLPLSTPPRQRVVFDLLPPRRKALPRR